MLDISNVIAALSDVHVQKLTGLTKRQLRYWDETGFFKPSFVEAKSRLPIQPIYPLQGRSRAANSATSAGPEQCSAPASSQGCRKTEASEG